VANARSAFGGHALGHHEPVIGIVLDVDRTALALRFDSAKRANTFVESACGALGETGLPEDERHCGEGDGQNGREGFPVHKKMGMPGGIPILERL
jgi:hypothetical protein